jgi:hypothetical protein
MHAPEMYRGLVDAAWAGLHSSGHGSDRILFGEVAPRGNPNPLKPKSVWGVFAGIKPLPFLRSMSCVDSSYRELRGTAAAVVGCPTTPAGSNAFRARNPALFGASGFSDHAYSRYFPPNVELKNDPGYSSLADIGQLERALDRLTGVYGSKTKFPIWNTEYGYITSPPKHSPDRSSSPIEYYVSPATAAAYLNQAEYISYKNPRIMSFMQYLLQDASPATKATDYGGFASGLETFQGTHKATYAAWRMPLYLPRTKTGADASLEVWGDVRPAFYALTDVGAVSVEGAQIQFAPGRRGGTFETIDTVPLTNPHGYFDTHVVFPGNGRVRLAWVYPDDDSLLMPGSEIYSRTVSISVG